MHGPVETEGARAYAERGLDGRAETWHEDVVHDSTFSPDIIRSISRTRLVDSANCHHGFASRHIRHNGGESETRISSTTANPCRS